MGCQKEKKNLTSSSSSLSLRKKNPEFFFTPCHDENKIACLLPSKEK